VWHKDTGKLLSQGFWTYWSFGDGASSREEAPLHTYRYPGTYVVALTVGREGTRTTKQARITLTIHEARLSVPEATQQRIILANESSEVAEVGGWRIALAGGASFTIPEGTLLAPWAKVPFPREITGLAPHSPEEVSLFYPNGLPVALLPAASSSALGQQPAAAYGRAAPHSGGELLSGREVLTQRERQSAAAGKQEEEAKANAAHESERSEQAAPPAASSRQQQEKAAKGNDTAQAPQRLPQLSHASVTTALLLSSLPEGFPVGTFLLMVGGSVAIAWFFNARLLQQPQAISASRIDDSSEPRLWQKERGAKEPAERKRQQEPPQEGDLAAAQQEARAYDLFP
jgi:PKD repeat protein